VTAAHTLRIEARTGAVLFDLDGTLADTDPLHTRAWQLVASREFGVTFTWEEYRDSCLRDGLSPVGFLATLGVETSSPDLRERKDAVFRELIETELTLAPGVADFIHLIHDAAIPVGIVSSGGRYSVDSFIASLWPGRLPAVTVSRDDTQRQKPDPEPYRLALRSLGREPAHCVAVEDSSRGLRAAIAAGLQTIRVSTVPIDPGLAPSIDVARLSEMEIAPDGVGAIVLRPKTTA
jgi:HAD superfamily hydrolase (TIGR01509 family)